MPKRCFNCKSTDLQAAEVEERRTVAAHTFTRMLPVTRCAKCGEETIPLQALEAFDLEVAEELARHGEVSAEAFSFMRRTLGMKAADLAELLDVTPGTVSRWENGHEPIERRAAALLCALVLDRVEGRTGTLDRLRALLRPEPLPRVVRLAPRHAGT